MAANEEERGGTPCGVHLRLIYHRGNGARSLAWTQKAIWAPASFMTGLQPDWSTATNNRPTQRIFFESKKIKK